MLTGPNTLVRSGCWAAASSASGEVSSQPPSLMSPNTLIEEMSKTSSLKLVRVRLALEKLMPGKAKGPKSVEPPN